MKRFLLLLSVLIIVLIGAWIVIGLNRGKTPEQPLKSPSSSTTTPKSVAEILTRSDEGQGGVTIDVIYATQKYFEAEGKLQEAEKYNLESNLVFIINLNTHTVELSQYFLEELTYLKDDKGKTYRPSQDWEPLSESSHHRSGVLKFSKADASGNSIITPQTKFLEVVIEDIAGVKTRTFRWNLPIKYP